MLSFTRYIFFISLLLSSFLSYAIQSVPPPLTQQLLEIRIPELKFKNVPIDTAIETVLELANQYNDEYKLPEGITVRDHYKIIYEKEKYATYPVTITLRNFDLGRIIEYFGKSAQARTIIYDNTIFIYDPNDDPTKILSYEYYTSLPTSSATYTVGELIAGAYNSGDIKTGSLSTEVDFVGDKSDYSDLIDSIHIGQLLPVESPQFSSLQTRHLVTIATNKGVFGFGIDIQSIGDDYSFIGLNHNIKNHSFSPHRYCISPFSNDPIFSYPLVHETEISKLPEHIPLKEGEAYLWVDFENPKFDRYPAYLINLSDQTFEFDQHAQILTEYLSSTGEWIRAQPYDTGLCYSGEYDMEIPANTYRLYEAYLPINGNSEHVRYSIMNNEVSLSSNAGMGLISALDVRMAAVDVLTLDGANLDHLRRMALIEYDIHGLSDYFINKSQRGAIYQLSKERFDPTEALLLLDQVSKKFPEQEDTVNSIIEEIARRIYVE